MSPRPPLIRITAGAFFRQPPLYGQHNSDGAAAGGLFRGLDFELPHRPNPPQNWCVVGPSLSGKTSFLRALQGLLYCSPPSARSYPALSADPALPRRLQHPQAAIRYVEVHSDRAGGRSGGVGLGGLESAYLSARYESRREVTDISLGDYLVGNTELNAIQPQPDAQDAVPDRLLDQVVAALDLASLLRLPAAFLSNGQKRRACIARALLTSPELLLLDEPFMGLDPPSVIRLSKLLGGLANRNSPMLVMASRPQDMLPDWITHLIHLTIDGQVSYIGPKTGGMFGRDREAWQQSHQSIESARTAASAILPSPNEPEESDIDQTLVEMDGCRVQYGSKVIIGGWSQRTTSGELKTGLVWKVRRGERWALLGPNGSGKTTIASLMTSDHPQAYAQPIKLFGRSRLAEPGSSVRPMTYWDVQARIGHSSPEVHQHIPGRLTVRATIESAWADTFATAPILSDETKEHVLNVLRLFEPQLNKNQRGVHDGGALLQAGEADNWYDRMYFSELSFSAQQVVLFLRAVVKTVDLVILDEPFSGMDDVVKDKCAAFLDRTLSHRQALVCISHVREEVPGCIRHWLRLPLTGSPQPPKTGAVHPDRLLRDDEAAWRDIWTGFDSQEE